MYETKNNVNNVKKKEKKGFQIPQSGRKCQKTYRSIDIFIYNDTMIYNDIKT